MTENTAAPIVDYVPIYSCPHCAPLSGSQLPLGWIDETWPTRSGGKFRFMSCFSCRHTVVPFDRSDPRWQPSVWPRNANEPDAEETA